MTGLSNDAKKSDIPLIVLLRFTAELVAILALIYSLVIRLNNCFHPLPLWIDETFTGAIAGQKEWRDFISMARADAPPSFLYYCFMHVWQMAFGLSDSSLRAPSLICSIATPLIIILSLTTQLSRLEKLTWAALLALWIPGIGFAQDARCYAILLMLATIQTLTFYRLLQTPSFRNTVIWVLSADLTMFGNYDAAYLTLAQGLVFIVLHRQVAFKHWPSIFLTLPVISELAWKWPIISKFERIGTAWYPILHFSNVIEILIYPIAGLSGTAAAVWILLLPVLCVTVLISRQYLKQPYHILRSSNLNWVAMASLTGGIVMIAIGFLRPTFTWRYMPPFEPGIMLGFILVIRFISRDAREIGCTILMLIAVCADQFSIISGTKYWDSAATPLNIETASEYLMAHGAHNVVFTWDSPTPRVMPLQLLTAVGSFFFQRAGASVNVIAIETHPNKNTNLNLLDNANYSHSAIIWLYDKSVKTTTAIAYPPNISEISPHYKCNNFGEGPIGSLACYVKP